MTKQEWNVAFDYVEHLKQQTFFFRPGLYVRLELRGVPCEFVTNFDPHYPLVVGGLLAIERSQSYLRARVKRHRWYKRILKVGYWWWRRRQTRRQRISVISSKTWFLFHGRATNIPVKKFGSVAEWVKASFLRRPWSHDLGSTPTLVRLLRPGIRRFTMIISAWWLRTSSKFTCEEDIGNRKAWKRLTPKRVRTICPS